MSDWTKRRFVTAPRGSLFGIYGPEAQDIYKLAIPRPQPLENLDEDDDRDPLRAMFVLPEWLIDAIISDHAKAALLDEAVKALEPFAKLAMPGREGLPDDRKYLVVDNTWLTLGDFRRATAIFTRLRDVPVHDTKGG